MLRELRKPRYAFASRIVDKMAPQPGANLRVIERAPLGGSKDINHLQHRVKNEHCPNITCIAMTHYNSKVCIFMSETHQRYEGASACKNHVTAVTA